MMMPMTMPMTLPMMMVMVMSVAALLGQEEAGYRAVTLLEEPGFRRGGPPTPGRLVMPCALSVRPTDGKLFVASMKMGEIFRVDLEEGREEEARFVEYAGPFQEPYAMAHRGADLYVLHRRNISRIRDADGDGVADSVDRVATWPQGLVSSYDWGYGLVPEADGSFLFGLAPWANREQLGSGGVVRLRPDGRIEEVAHGFRNHVGWCAGPGGELFVVDNQGEWVAANCLFHVVPGRFHGFPNRGQPDDRERPRGRPAVWIPYAWSRSINGVVHDSTAGKFGPFAGQFFLAELYTGGAIIRAQLEKVKGEYQGACFPFRGRGLLGPLALTFDRRGRLLVGGITEPAWMGQPDRGALYRLEYVGPPPFEIHSVHARPRGFELVFTRPVDRETAENPSSYRLHHYRYQYGPEYGSPELDRTDVPVTRAACGADRRRVELTTPGLVRGRVYRLRAGGVRSASGEPLVHSEAAYTLNEIPEENDLPRNEERR